MKTVALLQNASRTLIASAFALIPLASTGTAYAREKAEVLGVLTIPGAPRIELVTLKEEGAGPDEASKVQIRVGAAPLLAADFVNLNTCAPGSPALETRKGVPLSDLMDHPKIRGGFVTFAPEIEQNFQLELTCGERDQNGNPTLRATVVQSGDRLDLGEARINAVLDRWEFQSTETGRVYPAGIAMLLEPKKCRFTVDNEVHFWEGGRCPPSPAVDTSVDPWQKSMIPGPSASNPGADSNPGNAQGVSATE